MSTKDDRLYLRINSNLKQNAEAYGRRHSISISCLVTRFLMQLLNSEQGTVKKTRKKRVKSGVSANG